MKKLTFLFILSCCSIIGFSQNAIIKGFVFDNETNEALIAATISAGEIGSLTNYDGSYELELAPGSYQMVCSYVGFNDMTVELNLKNGQVYEQDFSLSASSVLLETATVTGSKYERSLAESPVSINVIKHELVSSINSVEISDVIDKVPGVQLIDGQANIRGGSGYSFGAGSRVMLLIDDVPTMQPDAGRPSWADIPVENISQVEILKGASSVLYGSAALNGIINIRTGYATSKPETKVNVAYTHFMGPKDERKQWWEDGFSNAPNQITTGILHKRKIGKLDLVLNGYYENFDHFYKDSYKERGRVSANFRYRITDRIVVGMNSVLNVADNSTPFIRLDAVNGAYIPFPGAENTTKNFRSYFDPYFTAYDKHNNKHKLLLRYYYIDNENNNNQSNSSKNYFGEYQFVRDLSHLNMYVSTGVTASIVNSNSELYGPEPLQATNYAAFAQLDKKFFDRLNASVGVRIENNKHEGPEVFRGDTIPGGINKETKIIKRASLNYEVSPYSFLRASYGEGYRFPTIAERYIATSFSGFPIYPNLLIRSETGFTAEIGIKQGFKIVGWQGYADFSTFWSQYDDMLEFSLCGDCGPEPGFQSQNIGNTDIKGFEFNILGQFSFLGVPFNILSGYTYIDPTYRDFDNNEKIRNSLSEDVNVLKYRSKHNFKVDLEGAIGKFIFGLSANRTSHMINIDGLFEVRANIGIYRDLDTNGYIKYDARLAYQFDYFKLSFVGNNLLNEEYTARPGYFEAPRNIAMRMDFKF